MQVEVKVGGRVPLTSNGDERSGVLLSAIGGY